MSPATPSQDHSTAFELIDFKVFPYGNDLIRKHPYLHYTTPEIANTALQYPRPTVLFCIVARHGSRVRHVPSDTRVEPAVDTGKAVSVQSDTAAICVVRPQVDRSMALLHFYIRLGAPLTPLLWYADDASVRLCLTLPGLDILEGSCMSLLGICIHVLANSRRPFWFLEALRSVLAYSRRPSWFLQGSLEYISRAFDCYCNRQLARSDAKPLPQDECKRPSLPTVSHASGIRVPPQHLTCIYHMYSSASRNT